MTRTIQGAGGGGGGGFGKGGGGGGGGQQNVTVVQPVTVVQAPPPPVRTPVEENDSLESVQYASVLDLISEGEIQGLDNGLQSVFLNQTPVVSASGGNNFTGYAYDFRTGTQAQAYISDLPSAESENAVNVEVLNSTSITRTITDSDVNIVRVTMQIPSLQRITDEGDILGFDVRLQIQIQYNGGGYTTYIDNTISGKTTNAYQRDYTIALNGSFPVDVRVVRVSADETTGKRQNRTIWASYTEIIEQKLRYPNSALAYLKFDARQFNSIPARKYLIRGIKVRLPSNATVDTTTYLGRVTYNGVWDGTFGAATWCADPAWCLWDLLTNTRYGAGIPESSLDKFDFYAISQYCNVLVSNGFGGLEPRFQSHVVINSRDELYTVIQEFVALFRGITYYGAGSIVILQDRPSDAQYLLGTSNVINGNFTYSGTSQKVRHTTATVAYQNYDMLGEVEFEYVEDSDSVAKYGVINKDIRAFGCYSRGQAHRIGKWALLSEQNLTETVSFGVSIDSGIILRPGMVINIADPVKSGARRSGRVVSGTTTTVTIDDSGLTLDLTKVPTMSVLLPNGIAETRAITSQAGTTFTVAVPFSIAPASEGIWLIETNDIQANQFRVLSVGEGENAVFNVTALTYNASIYDAIETDIKLEFRDISNLNIVPDPPSNLTATEHLYIDGQTVKTAVELSWISPVRKTSSFFIQYRLNSDNWRVAQSTASSIQLLDLKDGRLEVLVYSLSAIGKRSEPAIATFTLFGKLTPPGQVQNLTIEPISANSARLRWDATVDLDVKVGGRVHIRHTNLTDGTGTWSNSVDLIPAIAGYNTEAIVPLVEGEILVKFEDDGGRQSTNETSVIVDLPDTLGPLIIQTRREDQDTPPFQGNKTDVFYSEEFDALALDGDALIDAIADFDLIASFDYLGSTQPSGTYEFTNTLDLGAAFSLDLSRYFVTRGFYPNDLIDYRSGEVDTWTDWDGGVIDAVNAKLYLRRTPDDPAGSPVWSSWQEFANGTFAGRGFQFKAELTSNDPAQNILIDELGYAASFQRWVDQSLATVTSGAGSYNVTFNKPFFTGTALLGSLNAYLPSVGITAQNMQSGDFFAVSNVSSTGFTVVFRNSGGTAVSRQFNWSAVGYGKGV